MKACKHEIADRLIPLGGSNLDGAHFGTRQPNLQGGSARAWLA
jgi:hypothetical protein